MTVDGTRFGVGVWQGLTSSRLGELARSIEHAGFDQLWYSNHKLYRDLWIGLALAAQATERIEIGSFVAEPYSQHPAQIAAAVATIDELSGGRAILGLGAGGANFKELGTVRMRPAVALKESVEIARGLLRGERISYRGEVFTAADVWLHLPWRAELPIVVASRGDRVLRMAGEVADGVMIATYATPEGLRHGRDMVRDGLAKAGRSEADIRFLTRVDVALDEDPRAARNAVRPMIAAMVMASYPDTAFLAHAGLEITPELEAMSRQKNEALAFASGDLVPDEYVRQFAWVGTPGEVAAQIAAVVDSGFDTIVFLPQPMNVDPEPILQRFAREVIPRVRSEFDQGRSQRSESLA
ncbi:MAG TPA: LLM class flavin-dependent oxidoreductase [Chloroflexota bacterium]|jgi:5,10-methylenetetrahydromethanopterin reductase